MKILIVNPNTTASMTEKIGAAARAVAASGTEVVAVNPQTGPVSIEGHYDEVFAVPGLIEEVRKGEALGADGYVVACFDDPGLDAVRTVTAKPAVGICEAAMHVATLLGTRFSVVTTLARTVPAVEALARRYGVADRCRVRAADVPVLALEDPASDAVARVKAEIRRALAEDRAECVLLGCAGMADLTRSLTAEFGLPVIDGVAAATKLVEALVGLGLATSKVGGYATPLAKEYKGSLAGFSPR